MEARILKEVESAKELPSDLSNIPPGRYVISGGPQEPLFADGPDIKAELWFKSQALDINTIRKIDQVQLFAKSHDQGGANKPSAGNWTWFEIAIFENETSWSPRVKDNVELVWKSHDNRFLTNTFDWASGKVFTEQHHLLRMLEDGNVIAVRRCARFAAWGIYVEKGYLAIDIGAEDVTRKAPPPYREIVTQVKGMHAIFQEVNDHTNAGFTPKLSQNIFKGGALSTGGERPLRVLALDGGGVRGLSSLRILKAVMDKISPGTKPCDVFDMIGGTSTGGYIAIMLGRLKMSVDDCIKSYESFRHSIFDKTWIEKNASFIVDGNFYDAQKLTEIIQGLVKDQSPTHDPNTLMFEATNPKCKVFALAARQDAGNNHSPVFLRSYQNPREGSALPNIRIWEAARATSAAPAYFAPIKVQGPQNTTYQLVDGGFGANNPLGWYVHDICWSGVDSTKTCFFRLWNELLSVYGPTRSTACFLSIGTGIDSNRAIEKPRVVDPTHSVEESFASAVTNTEAINLLFRSLVNAFAPTPMQNKYWRLNVSKKQGDDNFQPIGDLDDNATYDKVFGPMTTAYIKDQDAMLEECAKAIMAQP